MSDDLTKRARAALEGVPDVPWFQNWPPYHAGMVEVCGPSLTCRGFTLATDVDAEKAHRIRAEANFIAAARVLVPAMADALDAQAARIEALERELDEANADAERLAMAGRVLLHSCEVNGLADNIAAQVFPDSKRKKHGKTNIESCDHARRAMNEMRPALAAHRARTEGKG